MILLRRVRRKRARRLEIARMRFQHVNDFSRIRGHDIPLKTSGETAGTGEPAKSAPLRVTMTSQPAETAAADTMASSKSGIL